MLGFIEQTFKVIKVLGLEKINKVSYHKQENEKQKKSNCVCTLIFACQHILIRLENLAALIEILYISMKYAFFLK